MVAGFRQIFVTTWLLFAWNILSEVAVSYVIATNPTKLSYPSFHQRLAFTTREDVSASRRRTEIRSRRRVTLYRQQEFGLPTTTAATTALRYTNKNIDETTTSTSPSSTSTTVVTTVAETSLTGVIVDVTFTQHRPLGCIIEESLVTPTSAATMSTTTNNKALPSKSSSSSQDNRKKNHIVFITSVTANGFADRAGLLVGDVIIGVSTAFTTSTSIFSNEECTLETSSSTIMDVTGFGIDRVKSLIMCRYDNEPFTLRVLRGTTALQDHEVALTELCSNPDTTSTEAEQCMIDFIQGGYAMAENQVVGASKTVNIDNTPDDGECNIPDSEMDDGECLLNDMHSLWASDLPMSSSQQQPQPNTMSPASSATSSNKDSAAVVKPWSSRASPSGTFVRDPATGKMKNLDANQ